MNFFRKIFGSTNIKVQSKETDQVDILEPFRKVPWMTELRLVNITTCLNSGFRPSNSLPTEFERKLRPTEEIGKRLNAIKAIVLWLMVSENDLPNDRILSFVDTNELADFLTDDEKEILKSSRSDDELRNSIGWKFENAWPLAWFFGYEEPEITGIMMTGEQMQEILMKFTCPLNEKVQDWIVSKESISEAEVIQMEDLFYCVHNAVKSAQLGRPTVPSFFDPIENGGVIHERRHSLTWMLSEGADWDETDLST